MASKNPILMEVFSHFGSASKLAAHFGVSRAAVNQWKFVPLRYLREINRVTGIPKSRLRPDIFEDENA